MDREDLLELVALQPTNKWPNKVCTFNRKGGPTKRHLLKALTGNFGYHWQMQVQAEVRAGKEYYLIFCWVLIPFP